MMHGHIIFVSLCLLCHVFHSTLSQDVALSGYCQGGVDNECSDPNAECIKSKCTCNVGYYRFYEGNSQSNCRTVQELQVTGIIFSNIKTTEFIVSWTTPTRSSYVSGYDVEWQTWGKVVDATSPQKVTGLTPGKTYVVKVISKDTATQPGDTRETYTSKQQAAKPSIPGPVTSSENDLDASDGNIVIKWTAGAGVTTLYRVKLFDGDTQKGPRDTPTLSTTFYKVLNGYRYIVSVTARIQQFNENDLWSGTKVSTIKTKVQVPQAPRNGVCKSPTDASITLDWDAPSLPNGDVRRYHIDVINTASYKVLFRDKTTGTETQKVVGNLQPGINYIFRLYAENEGYNSTTYAQVSSACKTRAKMTEAPTKLAVNGVTSRGFDISWEKPENTYSDENYGYVLQIKDETSSCWKEVIYSCSDCSGSLKLSYLTNLCDPTKRDPVIDKTKQELASKLTYTAVLHPDIVYTVSVTAINDAGRGHLATYTQRTNEEAPQKPYQVSVTDIKSTNFTVNWEIGSPRPGNTTYTIKVITDIAQSKELNVVGYENRNYLATGLEEFWNYTVTVTASTSIGSVTSDVSDNYRTLPAAPGKVSHFSVQDGPGQTLKISWKAPHILERNSIIKKYRFIHNAIGDLQSQQTLNQNGDENDEYSISLDVVPETFYYFEVFAINEQDMNGEKTITIKQAHAKVPVNIEETLGVDVIPLRLLKDIERTQFTVTLLKEFFEESTNGKITATGIIACVKDCNLEDIKKVTDFDTMKTWKQYTDQGSGFYRVTSPSWFDEIQTFCNTGRKKRSIKSFEYTLGSEYCTYLPADEYCNGPLQPGTSYKLVAVVCNIGGCLLSRQYGPFITAAAAHVIEDSNCSTQSLVIGLVLGLINLVLLVYAGYTTITLRRIRTKDGQKTNSNDKSGHVSQTYANEAFGSEVTRRDYGNPAGQYSESEYLTLDANTREDKTTYDTLRNGP